jgi:hypothetical protein
MEHMMLFGVETTDTVSQVSSIVGAATSTGVLGWLLFRGLPDKDKQIKDLVDSKDKAVKDVLERKDELVKRIQDEHAENVKTILEANALVAREARSDYKEALKMIIDHCQRENAAGQGMFLKALDEVRLAVCDLREAVEAIRTKDNSDE